VVLGSLAILLAHTTADSGGIIGSHSRLLAAIAAWWAVWVVAVACLRRSPWRAGVVVLLVVSVAMRVAAVSSTAPLSDDLYRYAWDARVQAAGIDPYQYPPAAPELAPLRDPWLWPGVAGCTQLGRGAGCTRINRSSSPTIYPPLAQLWFLGVSAAGASRIQDVGWELSGLTVDLALVVLLLLLLRRWGRNPLWAAVYAWSPLAVLEAVQNAHVDVLAALAVVVAVAVAQRRPALAATAVAAATLVKLYPLLVLPALLRRGWRRPVLGVGGLIGVAYLPHLLAAGPHVAGYLPGYLSEEQYSAGGRYLLLDLLGLHGTGASLVAAAAILATIGWAAYRVRSGAAASVDATMRMVLAVALLIATPVQPWYGLSLAALAALAGQARWLAISMAAYPLYFAVVTVGPNPVATRVGQLAFAGAAAVQVAAWWLDRRSARRPALRPEAAARVPAGAAAATASTISA
jgi:Glycosyltransferase family 87